MVAVAQAELNANSGGGGTRVLALDALRGVAVAGIALMNVIAFSMPGAAYVNPGAYGGTGPVETALWSFVFVLVEDKFRALFAMLFGAGVAILLGKGGNHPWRGHAARMAVLFAIGWLHSLLLANNDILRVYAVGGLLLPFVTGLRPRTLLWLAAMIVAAQLVVSGYVAWGWLEYWYRIQTGAVTDPAPLIPAQQRFGADADVIAASLERGREAFAERMDRRMSDLLSPITAVMSGLPSSLAAMLVGMAFWKNGLLHGEWQAARMKALAVRMVAVTFPVLIAMAAMIIASGFDPVATASIVLVWSAPFDLLLAIGWAALAMLVFMRGGAIVRLWADVGRLALTNYLLTSLVFAALFASWGLGLFGDVGRAAAYVISVLPIAIMLFLSPLWLRRFRQGPAEWAWRSLSQAKALPLRLP